jgi:branched-chain amino acid transport system substrate-binding protein
MQLAAELAADEINAAGGIGGRRLELVIRDDYADPDSAVFIATDLYESGVSAVIGHIFSGMSLAAAPVYNGGADPVAAISPSSSSPELTSAGDYTFRICPSDLAHGAALAHWVSGRLRLTRGAVLFLNDQYGRGIRQTFVTEFTRLGGQLESIDPYLGDKPDVGAYLDRLARSRKAEFLVVAGNRGEAEEIIRQARRRGLAIPVLGGDGLEGIHEAGALAEGVYLSSAYFPNLPTEANRRFVEAYRRKYPGAGIPNQPAAAAYDAVYLLRDVIARAGTDRAAVRRALAGVGSATPPFEGVTGTVAFDAAGDVPNQTVYIGLVRGGNVIVTEDATETVAQVP